MEKHQTTISDFHAHIYFAPATRTEAEKFRAAISDNLAPKLRYFGNPIDCAIGPGSAEL